MDIKEFIENFAGQLEIFDSSRLKPETRFKDLDEWSSLVAISVIAMVDDEYDVTIGGGDIRNSDTVEDLFNIVRSKAE